MKKNAILAAALLLLIRGADHTHGGVIHLGEATFNDDSDQVSAAWFLPMPANTVITHDGFGDKAGVTRTETFSLGESVAGVKAVKWQITHDSLSVPNEVWWLAFDSQDNLRVLKLLRPGLVDFTASANTPPPVFLPGTPAVGQTWSLLGAAVTVEDIIPSQSGFRLKVKTVTAEATEPVYSYYHAGTGLVHVGTTSSPAPSGSGWSVRRQPVASVSTPSQPPLSPPAAPVGPSGQ